LKLIYFQILHKKKKKTFEKDLVIISKLRKEKEYKLIIKQFPSWIKEHKLWKYQMVQIFFKKKFGHI
jgi:hypothetical protein